MIQGEELRGALLSEPQPNECGEFASKATPNTSFVQLNAPKFSSNGTSKGVDQYIQSLNSNISSANSIELII